MPHRVAAALLGLVCALGQARQACAQAAPAAAPRPHSSRPFEIIDNSFFVEEAFNQDPGVVQNIVGGLLLQDAGWATTFTQEWPAPGVRHQLSYTLAVADVDRSKGFGDAAINYRYQWLEEGPGRPAASPRFTLLLPSGNAALGLGAGAWGMQVNLPVSKQVRDVYVHGNAGLTWYPSVDSPVPSAGGAGGLVAAPARALVSPSVAASAIYRIRPMVNLMLESVVIWQDRFIAPGRTGQTMQRLVSPGLRTGWNRGDSQYIVGAAVPVNWNSETSDAALFLYFSYETRFKKARTP